MIQITIDHTVVKVPDGTTVMKAAELLGKDIPSMCFMEGYENHPSCMICMVKEAASGKLFPSCATLVREGMEIITLDEEIMETRKKNLELLISDHVGDCEAPCRLGCPAFVNIPLVNRLIASGKLDEAIVEVRKELAIPGVFGHICEAPCEKVCRRRSVDEPISICQLEKFIAVYDKQGTCLPSRFPQSGKKIAIIGSGPAGLGAAWFSNLWGHETIVFDRNEKPGGSLLSINPGKLPAKILAHEIDILVKSGVKFRMKSEVDLHRLNADLKKEFDAIIIATGENDRLPGDILLPGKSSVDKQTMASLQPGIFLCGGALRKKNMAVKAMAQGKSAAWSAHLFLNNQSIVPLPKVFNSKFGKLLPEELEAYLAEAESYGLIIPENGMLEGFNTDEAKKEALRCMHCDCRNTDQCKLRMYCHEYHVDRRRYHSENRKILHKYFQHHDVVYEPEKCIRCGLCVEITTKNHELTGLSYIGRGFDVKIGIPLNRNLEQALQKTAEKCVLACPTSALSYKNLKQQ